MALHHRRTKKHQKNTPNQNSKKDKKDVIEQKVVREEPLYITFLYHPIVIITIFIVVPYALHLSYFYLILQQPSILSHLTLHLLHFRPAIRVSDERQLLIVGSMSSGTVQISSELSQKLNVELAHESSDAQWSYARDGTVSWFHGIRFMTPPSDPTEQLRSIAELCSKDHPHMGFHPSMYRPPIHRCSYRTLWNDCWQKECASILAQEWGCAARKDCEISFHTTLHQVRNPLKTMESLYVKFCHVESVTNTTFMDTSFLIFANQMFRGQHNFTQDSCWEAVGHFVLLYNTALVNAHDRGEIASYYQIEEVSSCDIATLAGWTNPDTTVYPPHYSSISQICQKESAHTAHQIISQQKNRVNQNYVHFTWKDLRPLDSTTTKKHTVTILPLETQLKDLSKRLGYDIRQEDL